MPGLVPPSYHVEAQYVPDDDVLAICCPACGHVWREHRIDLVAPIWGHNGWEVCHMGCPACNANLSVLGWWYRWRWEAA